MANKWQEQREAIDEAMEQFPSVFGLRSSPDKVFRISATSSYFSGEVLYLYTEVQDGDKWISFAKSTVDELRREVVTL
jgi:hypothetical protein